MGKKKVTQSFLRKALLIVSNSPLMLQPCSTALKWLKGRLIEKGFHWGFDFLLPSRSALHSPLCAPSTSPIGPSSRVPRNTALKWLKKWLIEKKLDFPLTP